MSGARGDRDPGYRAEVRDTVLVVEDEVLVRMMVADELRNAGYVVVEASNAQEALDVLRHNSKPVKVLVSDVRMPGSMDGVGLARLLRLEYPGIKIVLTSGRLPAIDGAEHDGFFPKPHDPAKIVRHVKALLD